jgi:hypothetical protein
MKNVTAKLANRPSISPRHRAKAADLIRSRCVHLSGIFSNIDRIQSVTCRCLSVEAVGITTFL